MKKFLLLFLLFCQSNLFGQDYAVRHFSVTDGLPSGNLVNLFQDSRGYLWVSTLAGISRFDGKSFKNYSIQEGLPVSFSSKICEDSSGNLYISYGTGVARFDGEHFTSFQKEVGGRNMFVRDLIPQEDGSLLIVTRMGLATLRGDSIEVHPNPEKRAFYCGLKAGADQILVGGTAGIYQWKNEKLIPFIEENGERVQSMIIGPDSFLWYGLLHNKLKRKNLAVSNQKPEQVDLPQVGVGFVAAFLDSDEEYVYVAHQQGFLIYKNGKFIKNIAGFLKVPSDVVNAITVDSEGNVWVGSLFGLWRLSKSFTTVYPSDSIVGKSLYAIQSVGKDSVIFTDGFYYYTANNEKVTAIFKDKPRQGSEVYDILHTQKGYTYFGSGLTGLMVRDPKGKYENVKFGPGPFYRCMVLNQHKGTVYSGSAHGYYTWDGIQPTEYTPDFLKGQNVLSMWIDDELQLFGTNTGLYRRLPDGSYQSQTQLLDSSIIVISDIYRRNNNLFIGTKGRGLLIARYEGDSIRLDTALTRASGLPSDYVASTICDKLGQIWITTLQGLSKAVRLSDDAIYIRNYGPNQGVPDAFWEYCQFELDTITGALWIGNSGGLLRIQPEKELKTVAVPYIHFEEVILRNINRGGKEEPFHVFRPKSDSIYEVPYSHNDLQIHLNAVLLGGAEEVQYWYKLQGDKNDWVLAPVNGILELNNMAPGTYRLVVSAFNRANKAFSEEKVLLLKINRPFWMSGWFYFLVLIGFLGLVYAFFKWRVNQAFKKQHAALQLNKQLSESRYLAFQARMNPHFIFNSLNAIQYFITQNDKKSSLTYLSKFARLLRQVLDNTKAIKVPLSEEVDMLKNYLEMEFMRFDGHFTYSFEMDESLLESQYEIPGMLLQPFVENAIVHGLLHLKSGEGSLTISMKKEGEFILCTIEDNGVGREKASQINARRKPNHKSHGLEIASNRLKLLMENIPFEELIQVNDPEIGTGTIVQIKLPIL